MDLGLYLRVIGRFKALVAAGAALALLLALFSFVKIDPFAANKISYRQSEEWVSSAKLFVTERGFPLGSVDPGFDPRLTNLAVIYAQLADSDAVRAIVRRQGPVKGHVEIVTVPAGQNSDADLPLINVLGFSTSPEGAMALAWRQANAFRAYLRSQQARNGIRVDERVQVQVVQRPAGASLEKGRSKTLPIVIFLTVMIAVIGLAFLLENLRPRIRVVSLPEEAGQTGNVA